MRIHLSVFTFKNIVTFASAFKLLRTAKCPEDVFGMDNPPAQLIRIWELIESAMKSGVPESDTDQAAMLLDSWDRELEKKLLSLTYGEQPSRPLPDLNLTAEPIAFSA